MLHVSPPPLSPGGDLPPIEPVPSSDSHLPRMLLQGAQDALWFRPPSTKAPNTIQSAAGQPPTSAPLQPIRCLATAPQKLWDDEDRIGRWPHVPVEFYRPSGDVASGGPPGGLVAGPAPALPAKSTGIKDAIAEGNVNPPDRPPRGAATAEPHPAERVKASSSRRMQVEEEQHGLEMPHARSFVATFAPTQQQSRARAGIESYRVQVGKAGETRR